MNKLKKTVTSLVLFVTSLTASAGIGELGIVNPCESHFLGIIELDNSTRITAVESLIKKQLSEVKKRQRFIKYDVEEIANQIQQQFEIEAAVLGSKLHDLRSEFSVKKEISLSSGKKLDGFAATEYIKIMMSRYIAQMSGAGFLDSIYSELEGVEKGFGQAVGRLVVIDALIDSSSSDEVLSSACIALKEVDELKIDFPFKDADSLKHHALKQSKPTSDIELAKFLADGELPLRELSLGKIDGVVNWAKSLIN